MFDMLANLFAGSGTDPSAANAAGLTDENGAEMFGPPAPRDVQNAATNRLWGGRVTQGLQGLSSFARQQPQRQAMQAPQPQIHRGNPQALAAFTNNLLQRRAALMPRVPGLLGGRNG